MMRTPRKSLTVMALVAGVCLAGGAVAAVNAKSVIATTTLSPKAGWRFGLTDEPTMVRMKPRLTVTSNDGAIAAAVGGLGIARLLSYQVVEEVASGKLQVILAEYEEAPWPIHVLHRESKYGSSKVRTFIDMLAQTLRAQHLD